MPYFKLYVGDWLSDTLGLTLEEQGAYMKLLVAAAQNGSVPLTVLERWPYLADLFEERDGGLYPVALKRPRRRAIPTAIRRAVLRRDGDTCQLCGASTTGRPTDLDHIIPWSHGGPDTIENLRLTHASCNRSRGAGVDA